MAACSMSSLLEACLRIKNTPRLQYMHPVKYSAFESYDVLIGDSTVVLTVLVELEQLRLTSGAQVVLR